VRLESGAVARETVYGEDLPAVCSEPDRISSGTATEVEGGGLWGQVTEVGADVEEPRLRRGLAWRSWFDRFYAPLDRAELVGDLVEIGPDLDLDIGVGGRERGGVRQQPRDLLVVVGVQTCERETVGSDA
jgi:hypothetical protein